jgi:hypothetical protein
MTSTALARIGDNRTSTVSDRLAWRGRGVRDSDGQRIGEIGEIYVADGTTTPEWALVRTDAPGHPSSFLPLNGSRGDGDQVIVPFTKAQVADCPKTPEVGRLSPEQGAALYDHYGVHRADRGPSEVPIDRTGGVVVVVTHGPTERLARVWRQWLSDARGHHQTGLNGRPADKGHQLAQSQQQHPKRRQGEQHEDD